MLELLLTGLLAAANATAAVIYVYRLTKSLITEWFCSRRTRSNQRKLTKNFRDAMDAGRVNYVQAI